MKDLDEDMLDRMIVTGWRTLHSHFIDAVACEESEFRLVLGCRLGSQSFATFYEACRAREYLRLRYGRNPDGFLEYRIEANISGDVWRSVTSQTAAAMGLDEELFEDFTTDR